MKTYIKIQLVSVLALAMLIFNACTEDFDQLNTSNNLVTEDLINIDLMFTWVQVSAIHTGSWNGVNHMGHYCGMNSRDDSRVFSNGDNPAAWDNLYSDYSHNLSDIINICKKRNEENGNNDLDTKMGMARILRVWAYAEVTDIYGDIPYFESCLPAAEAVYQPKYDTQKEIYEDFFKELKAAAAQLNASHKSYGSADLIYGGNVEKWKKLANSLRLRLALRIRYADSDLATANMSDLNESNLITSLDDDAFILTADDVSENMNLVYTLMINRGYPHSAEIMGKTLADILIGSGDAHNPIDPRIALHMDTCYAKWPGSPGYEDIGSFGYRGRPLLGNAPDEERNPYGANTTSKLSAFWYCPIIERPVIRSSEVYFALAEAALFNLKAGDANALYQKGMNRAIAWEQKFYERCKPQMSDYLDEFYSPVYPDWDKTWEADYFADKEITQDEIDALKADPVYTLSGSTEEQFEMIMNQKMVALFPMEDQGWFEWRRTGYPRVLVAHDQDDLMGVSPRRYPWPQVEQSVNGDNYADALSRIGGTDGRLQKVWWDANPNAPHEHTGEILKMDQGWLN